jgi:hypothetical protein
MMIQPHFKHIYNYFSVYSDPAFYAASEEKRLLSIGM